MSGLCPPSRLSGGCVEDEDKEVEPDDGSDSIGRSGDDERTVVAVVAASVAAFADDDADAAAASAAA